MINLKTIDNIPVFQSDLLGTSHGFTGRLGGVSREKGYAELNLGVRTEDFPENVRKNYSRIKSALNIQQLVLAKQEHTDKVMAVDESHAGVGEIGAEAFPFGVDGLVTNCKNLALGVFTADCTPVLMYDPEKSVIAAVHSGWRGTVQKISEKAVELMRNKYGCNPSDIRASIGPSIGKCCFEIGEDAADLFRTAFPEAFEKFVISKGEKYMADNAGLVEYTLQKCGVIHIDKSDACTYCRNDLLFSHRRGDKGRQCGFIVMK